MSAGAPKGLVFVDWSAKLFFSEKNSSSAGWRRVRLCGLGQTELKLERVRGVNRSAELALRRARRVTQTARNSALPTHPACDGG